MTKNLNDEPEFAVELGEDEIEEISGGSASGGTGSTPPEGFSEPPVGDFIDAYKRTAG